MEQANNSFWYLQKIFQATKNSYKAIGYQQLTVTGTSQGLTVPAGSVYALISLESTATGIAIRFLELGGTTLPTTSTGIGRSNLDVWDVTDAANLANFQIIQAQSGTHTINVQYYAIA